MTTSNRSSGNRFEQEFAEFLDAHGFWAHVMQQNKSGQPADIIAVKGNYHCLIDCKVISDWREGFPLRRVEENQWYAMRRFERRCGEQGWFALKVPDGKVWMLPMRAVETLEQMGASKIPTAEGKCPRLCDDLETWLAYADNGGRRF